MNPIFYIYSYHYCCRLWRHQFCVVILWSHRIMTSSIHVDCGCNQVTLHVPFN